MRIAIAQINPRVGDVAQNASKIEKAVREAEAQDAELILAPEMALLGYPPKDILLNSSLISAQEEALKKLAGACRKAALYVGWAQSRKGPGKPLYNAASLLYQGKTLATHRKVLLPYYDVFDEGRYFEPGNKITSYRFKGLRLALTICEDIWNDKNYWEKRNFSHDPLEELKKIKPDLTLNISASPYWMGKPAERTRMLSAIAKGYKTAVIYANTVGGNDELLFDGASLVINSKGKAITQGAQFKEEFFHFDFPFPSTLRLLDSKTLRLEHEAYDALVMGLRDYVQKCGFENVVLGLSGGIDSSLVACLAADALGPSHVLGVLLPSRYSSGHSKEDAELLAKNLGIERKTVSIEPVFEAYLKVFQEIFPGLAPNIAEENIQARIRGAILMAISNKLGHLALATGNKSEIAMGYCTLYGDLMGGLAPISDCPKGLVYQMAAYRNSVKSVIPERTFTKPPSAELKPNQTDQDTLPPYDLLDQILEAYIVEGKNFEEIKRKLPADTAAKILTTVDHNEFKRRQAPPGLKISQKAFGFGRRMPIACRIEHKLGESDR
ncbi:MAG: NAD+ synthase [Elusimicrobia bacterium]|nr:NAD+ synthase [Elusimicrobiota bacterium]